MNGSIHDRMAPTVVPGTSPAHGMSRREFLLPALRPRAAACCWACASPLASWSRGCGRRRWRSRPTRFIRIGRDGTIVLTMPYVEMGQGTYTAIPMLIAEELEVDLAQVRLEHAPPNEKLYANPLLGVQATGNSNAIRGAWKPLRRGRRHGANDARGGRGAAVERRSAILSRTGRRGVCMRRPGRRLTYGELAAEAARVPVPGTRGAQGAEGVQADRHAGQAAGRAGKGQWSGRLRHRRPARRREDRDTGAVAGLRRHASGAWTTRAAKAVKGVRQIVRLDDAVAVVADHMGAAKKGLAALVIEWDDGPHATLGTSDIARELEQATSRPGAVAQNIGDVDKAMAGAATQGRSDLPGAVPRARDDGADELHRPSSAKTLARSGSASRRSRAPRRGGEGRGPAARKRSSVHNHLIGGGFGRRLESRWRRARRRDRQACRWSREGGLDARGRHPARHVPALFLRPALRRVSTRKAGPSRGATVSPDSSMIARWLPPAFKDGLDPDTTEGAIDLVYDLPNLHVEYVRVEPPGIPDRVLAQRRSLAQRLRHREFRRRTGGRGETGPRRLSARAPRQVTAREGRARSGRRKGRLGPGSATRARPRRRTPVRLRQLHGAGCRGGGGPRRRGSRPARRCARGLRNVVNPDTVQAQIQSANYLRHHRRTLWRDHAQGRPRGAGQFRHLSDAAHQRGTGHRGPHRARARSRRAAWARAGTSAIVPAITNAVFAATGKRIAQDAGRRGRAEASRVMEIPMAFDTHDACISHRPESGFRCDPAGRASTGSPFPLSRLRSGSPSSSAIPRSPGLYLIRVKVPRRDDPAAAQAPRRPHLHGDVGRVLHRTRRTVRRRRDAGVFRRAASSCCPATLSHFHWAKSGEYVTQVTAIGPLGLEYVNPADDPRERDSHDIRTREGQNDEHLHHT